MNQPNMTLPDEPSPSRRPEFRFSQDYTVQIPESQVVYPISVTEWHRLKGRINSIKPQRRVFEIIASVLVGIGAESLFALIALYSVDNSAIPKWVFITAWVLFISSVVLSPALYFLDSEHRKLISDAAQSVVADMNSIESTYTKAMGATSNQKE